MARSLLGNRSPTRIETGLTRRNGQIAPSSSASSLFTKQTFLILGAGILFGYVLLPVLMIEMNVDDAMKVLPTVQVKYPGSITSDSENDLTPHLRPVSSDPPNRGLGVAEAATASEAEKRLLEAHSIYSTQSMPTYSTPYVMKTVKLPDHKRKKILVTGGAGFVGSHLVDKLMMEGHEVTVLDNFFTGQKKNVAHWFDHPNFR